jgi:dipicolinate synthase subunit B
MNYIVRLNKKSTDNRVKILAEIFAKDGYQVFDIDDNIKETDKKTIFFFEPRFTVGCNMLCGALSGSIAFGYAKQLPDCAQITGIRYVCLSDDEAFVTENNRLTALALKQIIESDFGSIDQKMLVCGWGKLTAQIEKVFVGADLHILDFSVHKRPQLTDIYGERVFFSSAPTEKFPIIINTIPKELLRVVGWKKRKGQVIYELASAPFGVDWTGVDKTKYDYRILPALPGKYYPAEAGQVVYDTINRFLATVDKPTIVLCITGSACSYLKLLPILRGLVADYDVLPVISENANRPNRFTNIDEFCQHLREITGHNLITNIAGAETLSANKKIRASVIFPATGNTIAKLTHAITDTPVLMAVKALLRNGKPCIIGMSTNDALSGNAKNIGELLNRRNIYFVPFGQDDIVNKPFSMLCDFGLVGETVKHALNGEQLQPILLR